MEAIGILLSIKSRTCHPPSSVYGDNLFTFAAIKLGTQKPDLLKEYGGFLVKMTLEINQQLLESCWIVR